MLIGVALPQVGPVATPDALVDFARRVEAAGLSSVWVCERILRPAAPVRFDSGTFGTALDSYATVFDPVVSLAWVAAHTTRVTVGSSVLNAPFHRPAVLARSLATLDRLSEGRLLVGLGIGWMAEEFAATGAERSQRGRVLDDMIDGLRALWADDPVEHVGMTGTIPPSQYGPKPMQAQIPLLVGGASPAALQRSVQRNVGLNPVTMPARPRSYVNDVVAAVSEAWAPLARELSSSNFVLRIHNRLTDEPMTDPERGWMCGSPHQAAADAAALSALGVPHVILDMTMTFDGPQVPVDEQVRLLDELMALAGAEQHGS